MKFHIDKILQRYVDETVEAARLRRNGVKRDRTAVLAEILTKAEAAGDAMRYVDAKGRIAWKATPRLRGILEDLEADARADDEHEAV
jgi:hypothetical protein